ncbi:MAG: hypothetical protein ABI588_09760, partial [Arenimonas sp.]
RAVGVAQAEALRSANVKVIANGGTPFRGLSNAMDLFSAGGGTQIAAMLEGLAQSDEGRALLEKFTNKPSGEK